MDKQERIDYTAWANEWTSIARLHRIYHYAGPWDAPVVIIGPSDKGRNVPFTTVRGTEFAWRSLGTIALLVGWAYTREIPPQSLRSRDGIITCGESAAKWVKYHVDGEAQLLHIPSPKYLLTRCEDPEVTTVYESVRHFVENLIRKEG